jgi:hypothetical protein
MRFPLDSVTAGLLLVAGCVKHGNEQSDSVKGGEFVDARRDCNLNGECCVLRSATSRRLRGFVSLALLRW